MGNSRNTGYLSNVIKVSDTGNITFVSGSTTLATLSTTGQLSGSTPALSASYAATSSFANALNVAGTLTATTLVVQTITSSVDFVTGSTRFGSLVVNTHTFTGSVSMYGGNTGVNPVLSLKADTYGLLGISRGTQTNSSAGVNYFTGTSQKWFAGIYENSDNFGFYSVAYGGFPMVIASGSGNVGIGTSNPNKTLEILSTAEQLRLSYNNSTYTDFRTDSAGGLLINAGANYIINYIGSSEKMRITSGGNVGIGTTSPEGPLHINGASSGGYIGIAISNKVDAAGTTSGIDFGSDNSTCYNGAGNGQISVTNIGGTGGGQSSEMNLKVWTGSALVTGIKINNAGRVSFPTATAQNYGQSNASAVTITNGTSGTIASCTITSIGKPIFINLTGDINPVGGPSWCYVYIYRNGGQIGKYIIAESTASSANIPFALSVIDTPGSGNHTYTGYVTVNGSYPITFGETGNGQAPTILAIELI